MYKFIKIFFVCSAFVAISCRTVFELEEKDYSELLKSFCGENATADVHTMLTKLFRQYKICAKRELNGTDYRNWRIETNTYSLRPVVENESLDTLQDSMVMSEKTENLTAVLDCVIEEVAVFQDSVFAPELDDWVKVEKYEKLIVLQKFCPYRTGFLNCVLDVKKDLHGCNLHQQAENDKNFTRFFTTSLDFWCEADEATHLLDDENKCYRDVLDGKAMMDCLTLTTSKNQYLLFMISLDLWGFIQADQQQYCYTFNDWADCMLPKFKQCNSNAVNQTMTTFVSNFNNKFNCNQYGPSPPPQTGVW